MTFWELFCVRLWIFLFAVLILTTCHGSVCCRHQVYHVVPYNEAMEDNMVNWQEMNVVVGLLLGLCSSLFLQCLQRIWHSRVTYWRLDQIYGEWSQLKLNVHVCKSLGLPTLHWFDWISISPHVQTQKHTFHQPSLPVFHSRWGFLVVDAQTQNNKRAGEEVTSKTHGGLHGEHAAHQSRCAAEC